MLFVLYALIAVTVAAPSTPTPSKNDWSDVIKDANEAKEEFAALSEQEQKAIGSVLAIIGDPQMTDADKKNKINAMMKEGPEDAQKEISNMTDKSLQFASWFKDRLKKEDSSVQSAGEKIMNLLMDMKFIMSSDEDKEAQLNAAAPNLTADEKAVLDKVDEEGEAKEKELGLDKD